MIEGNTACEYEYTATDFGSFNKHRSVEEYSRRGLGSFGAKHVDVSYRKTLDRSLNLSCSIVHDHSCKVCGLLTIVSFNTLSERRDIGVSKSSG